MITGIKKTHKTTEIYFDEAGEWTTVSTYNTSLKNRLLAFSKEYPELCEQIDDDGFGGLSFRIQKKCFTYRLVAPYSEERKASARAKMNELNSKKMTAQKRDRRSDLLKIILLAYCEGRRVGLFCRIQQQ